MKRSIELIQNLMLFLVLVFVVSCFEKDDVKPIADFEIDAGRQRS